MDIGVLIFVLVLVFGILYSWTVETQRQNREQADQQRTPVPGATIAHATAAARVVAAAAARVAAAAAARANSTSRIAAIARANAIARATANNNNAAAATITDVVLQVPENFQQGDTTATTTTEVLENSQQKSEEELESLKKECVICLDEFDEAVKANTILLSCAHMFHRVCIHQWLKTQKTCPICRAPVLSHQFNSNA